MVKFNFGARGRCRPLWVAPFTFIFIFFIAAPLLAKTVTLRWDANRESDLAGYYIHYKTDPDRPYYNGTGADQGNSPIKVPIDEPNHRNYIDPNDAPEFTLTGLDDDLNYYFTLTAYNSEDLTSDFSNEVAIVEIISPMETIWPPRV